MGIHWKLITWSDLCLNQRVDQGVSGVVNSGNESGSER